MTRTARSWSPGAADAPPQQPPGEPSPGHPGGPEGGPLREWLRGLPLLAADPPPFSPADAPAEPLELLVSWLREAVAAGVPEPHALTLATVDAAGRPDARVVALRDVAESALWVASGAGSPKGRQLESVPVAALVFYWPQQGRQVRVRGRVHPGDEERAARDFLDRPAHGRAESLLDRQSRPLDETHLSDEFADVDDLVHLEPSVVASTWRLWGVDASRVEFWQSSADGQHVRLRYSRAEHGGYDRQLLRP
ncbi:pyridoxal 5'-phosphate synthase [Paenibacillus sp. TRM 82003]|uniref:pyridoxine/pyridoxamine 5'-phosphate oxidase n=1 Tax=Kineococcus sp. TRM81007 TaxID=2925831 RepID=UPI001F570318|nr:pyridoxal 5'-phosphate synthase [Kineococcus sp. TRM81007]MCI2237666.1 pyridoxal 5'-phosphate synthase [Kineococcus sp. TRM81007]MCI3921683.1 pyridoxal 5'-phosphate synthase [Paenibacillus sp. TRM 82003]